MRKNVLKFLACFLGLNVAFGCVSPQIHAVSLTKSEKILIGAGIGAGAVLGSAITLFCVYVIGGNANGEAVDGGTVTSKNHGGVDNGRAPRFSAEDCVDLKLRFWRKNSRIDVAEKQALDAALNIYSMETCGVKYKDLINRFNKSRLSLPDFYRQFSRNEIFIKERTYIENICLVLVGDPFDTSFNDTRERKALADVAKVVCRVQQTRSDILSEDLKHELEIFKKGKEPLLM